MDAPPIELRFDVSRAVGSGESLTQTAWCFAPVERADARGVLVCLAGGTYDKRYWHLEVPGYAGYSFAEHLASLGWCVLAVDHLGVGGSSDPSDGPIGLELLRDGDIAVVAQIKDHLAAGTLIDGLPQSELPVLGVGHSMGACLTTMVQAATRPYDAIAPLGYGVDIANVREGPPAAGEIDALLYASEAAFRQSTGAGDSRFHVVPREMLRPLFHAPDVPEAVMAADDALQSRVPVRAAAEVTTPGFVRRHAAAVDVPVFLAFGEVLDVSPDPHAEPANYRASRHVTLVVLEGSAHCHNMASQRRLLWDRLASWAATVADTRGKRDGE